MVWRTRVRSADLVPGRRDDGEQSGQGAPEVTVHVRAYPRSRHHHSGSRRDDAPRVDRNSITRPTHVREGSECSVGVRRTSAGRWSWCSHCCSPFFWPRSSRDLRRQLVRAQATPADASRRRSVRWSTGVYRLLPAGPATQANTNIATAALEYAGDTRRDPATRNLEVQTPDDVYVAINSSGYWQTSNGNDLD